VFDYTWSVPAYVLDRIARLRRAGKRLVVMAEEWHTADALMGVSDILSPARAAPHGDDALEREQHDELPPDQLGRLTYTASITAVSKFMKQIMREHGMNAIVIPNGIPERCFQPVDPESAMALRDALKRATPT